MALPPPTLLPHLNRWPAERFIGAALTAEVHRFAPDAPGGATSTAAVWLCATSERLWLVAHDPERERSWAVAWGRADDVRIETGWQRDTLHLGPHRCALRRSDRKSLTSLLRRWAAAGPQGDPWPPVVEIGPPAVRVARGAFPMHPGLAGAMPGIDAAERWLAAVETDGTWPLTGFQGSVDVTLLVAATDRRTVLLAPHPDGGPGINRALPAVALPTEGRAWRVAEARLLPRGPRDRVELVDALIAVTDPDERWGLACRHALIVGELERLLLLVREAFERGRSSRVWSHLGQLALAKDQPLLAVAAAWRALEDDEELDAAGVAALWLTEAPALKRTLKHHKLPWRQVRATVGPLFDAVADVPATPDALPSPPRDAREVWATALALHGRHGQARALWASGRNDATDATADAVLAQVAGATDAATRWERAAEARRAAGLPAWQALATATGLDETAALRWRWGTWAWIDGQHDEARASWRRALALDDGQGALDEPLDAPALRALAQVAVAAGRPTVAATVLHRAIELAPRHEGARLRLAQVLADNGQPGEAARVLVETAKALDRDALDRDPLEPGDDDVPRWRLWVDAAHLQARAGRPDEARNALHEALSGDFLSAQAWAAVVAMDAVHVPAADRQWRAHALRLLAGHTVAAPPGRPGRTDLDDATLDALHPGGAGWLETLRQSLDGTPAPPFEALTRGLDRLAEGHFDDAAQALHTLSEALALPVTPSGYVFRGVGAWGLAAWPSKPAVVLIGAEHLRDGPRHLSEAELRFALAAELVHLRCDHPVLAFDHNWLGTSRSVYDQISGWTGTAETVFDLLTLLPGLDQARKLQTVVKLARGAFKARSVVDKAVGLSEPVAGWFGTDTPPRRGLSRERLTGAALQFRLQAERAALLITGDLRAAVGAILKTGGSAPELAARVEHEGLSAVLADPNLEIDATTLLRLTALVAFAVT